jgi:iron(III) transport system substrate-binding protein
MPTVSAGDAKPSWEVEWERTVQAAKREGQVTVYISGYDAVLPVFQKEYPEIKVVGVTGRGHQLLQRLISERRAGKYLADVFNAGVPIPYPQFYRATKGLDPIRTALILSEVIDKSKWWMGRHLYADPDEELVFIYVGVIQTGGISYNTNLVDPKDFKSFRDFLNPKWKGRIEARDIRDPGPGSGAMRFFYHHSELGPKFVKRLFSDMDIILFRDFRQGPDWLATGKFAICFFCSGISPMKKQGLPVDSFGPTMKEGAGMVSNFGGLGLVNKAPHPNAAKVFINWLLSRKGQIALQTELAKSDTPVDSLRIDIPKEMIPAEERRVEGAKYLILDSRPETLEMEPIFKVMEEGLAEARKR